MRQENLWPSSPLGSTLSFRWPGGHASDALIRGNVKPLLIKEAGQNYFSVSKPSRSDGVIPVAMERGGLDVDCGEFLVCHLDAGRVAVVIESCPNLEPSCSGCVGDEVDNHLIADERANSPIRGDVAEQPVLDLVRVQLGLDHIANHTT